MKLNVILVAILSFLLLGTYFFQETKNQREYVESLEKDRLLKEEVKHLKLPQIEAVKKGERWFSGDQLLSHNTFNIIVKKLSEIQKIKEVQGEWKTFFSHPFHFEVNQEKWAIGDLSLDKQGFYVAKGDKIFLAEISGESVELTRDESEIAAIKLKELLSTLSKNPQELKENQLFRYYPELPMKRVVLSVEGSLPFELDFEKNTTSPPPIPGINVHQDVKQKFKSLLTQMTIKEEIPYSEKLKFKKLGELRFIGDKDTMSWELWLRGPDSADAVLIDPLRRKAYFMVGGTLKLFFIHLLDYWDKKVIPPEYFISFSRLESTFIQGNKEAKVIIYNKEPLEFEVKGHKVNEDKMRQLMTFIFNLGVKDQADRVSQLSKSEKQQLLSGNFLRINLMDQELIIWRKKEELIVVNLTQGFKTHFNLVDENFTGSFEDVLK